MVNIDIPGWQTLRIQSLLLDYNGVLALDGILLPGVEVRLKDLSSSLALIIATAGTHGPVSAEQFPFPVRTFHISPQDQAEQKKRILEELGAGSTITMGNGENDALMLKEAVVGIAVIGPEGASARAVQAADVVVKDIRDGLDLLRHPKRLAATLRR